MGQDCDDWEADIVPPLDVTRKWSSQEIERFFGGRFEAFRSGLVVRSRIEIDQFIQQALRRLEDVRMTLPEWEAWSDDDGDSYELDLDALPIEKRRALVDLLVRQVDDAFTRCRTGGSGSNVNEGGGNG